MEATVRQPTTVDDIIAALESAPDEAGPLVWFYPFREYH